MNRVPLRRRFSCRACFGLWILAAAVAACRYNGTVSVRLPNDHPTAISFPDENRVVIVYPEGGVTRLEAERDNGLFVFPTADGGAVRCARPVTHLGRRGRGASPPDDEHPLRYGPRGGDTDRAAGELLYRACEARANGFIDDLALATILLEIAGQAESNPGDTFLRAGLRACDRQTGDSGSSCRTKVLEDWQKVFGPKDGGAAGQTPQTAKSTNTGGGR